MLIPRQRIALDGKVWWCAYNILLEKWSTDIRLGKYETKKECQYAINKTKIPEIKMLEHTNCDYCLYQKMLNGQCLKGLQKTPHCRVFVLSRVLR